MGPAWVADAQRHLRAPFPLFPLLFHCFAEVSSVEDGSPPPLRQRPLLHRFSFPLFGSRPGFLGQVRLDGEGHIPLALFSAHNAGLSRCLFREELSLFFTKPPVGLPIDGL